MKIKIKKTDAKALIPFYATDVELKKMINFIKWQLKEL